MVDENLSDYEEIMMNNDDEFEEEVYVEKEDNNPEEYKLDAEISSMGKVKSEKDISEKESEEIMIDDLENAEKGIVKAKEEIKGEEMKDEEMKDEEMKENSDQKEDEIEIEEVKEVDDSSVKEVEESLEEVAVESEEEAEEDVEMVKDEKLTEQGTEQVVVKKTPNKSAVKNTKKSVNKKSNTKNVTKKSVNKKSNTKGLTSKAVKEKKSFWGIALSLIGIVLVIWLISTFVFNNDSKTIPAEGNNVIAKVNGEIITVEELAQEYEFFFLIGNLPEEYKQQISKDYFLESTLIPERLVLQEAAKKNLVVGDEEIDSFLQQSIIQAGGDMESFQQVLSEKGLNIEIVKDYFLKQIISFKLLNLTVLGGLEVSDLEISNAFDENADLFASQNQTFEDIKGDLKNALLLQKQRVAAQGYMDSLKDSANIEIFSSDEEVNVQFDSSNQLESLVEDETNSEDSTLVEEKEEFVPITFQESGDGICSENNKPLVIMFSTSWCPHCKWIADTFDGLAEDYSEVVSLYHLDLDTGDNILTTDIKENGVPSSLVELFQKYNPEGTVPTFVFGCKYFRIGTGYESQDDLGAEDSEFREIIESLI